MYEQKETIQELKTKNLNEIQSQKLILLQKEE